MAITDVQDWVQINYICHLIWIHLMLHGAIIMVDLEVGTKVTSAWSPEGPLEAAQSHEPK